MATYGSTPEPGTTASSPPATSPMPTSSKIDPADIARAREGLRTAGNPDVDILSDDQVVAEYLKIADPNDPFTQKLQQGSISGAPTPELAAKAFFTWVRNFKASRGAPPTYDDIQKAWGEAGVQIQFWGIAMFESTGKWPTGEEPETIAQVANIFANTPPTGSVGSAYAPQPSLDVQRFAWEKDFKTARAAAEDANNQAQLALSRGQLDLANKQFDYAKQQGDLANAIQLAGLTGTYNGQPTLAMQQFTQNQANFEKQFGLSYEQFQFQKDQFAKQYDLSEAEVTGMFGGNPTLAMQQFLTNKDQFAQNFAISEAGVTGYYKGDPTLEREQLAIQAAKYGHPLEQMAIMRGQPIQNYAGMPVPAYNQPPAAQPPPVALPTSGGTMPPPPIGVTVQPEPAPSTFPTTPTAYGQPPPVSGVPPPNTVGSAPTISTATGVFYYDPTKPGGVGAPVPKLASGGTMLQPGLALVGERGPEVVSLPPGAQVLPMQSAQAGGTVPYVTSWKFNPFTGQAADYSQASPEQIAAIQNMLLTNPPRFDVTTGKPMPSSSPIPPPLPGGTISNITPPPGPPTGDKPKPTIFRPPGGQTLGPPMPWNIEQIMAGNPLTSYTAPPGLRLAGAQAQAAESPLERAAREESYALAGFREEDLRQAESRIRRNLGTGLRSASYAPGRRYGS